MSELLAEPATARTSILLPPGLKEEAQRVARLEGVSLGLMVRRLLAKDVERRREEQKPAA